MENLQLYNLDDKVLLGNSISLPEEDLDSHFLATQEVDDAQDALESYWQIGILKTIGTSDFKSSYLSTINNIKSDCTLKSQLNFCDYILRKIIDVYDFEFPEKPVVKTNQDVLQIYKLLEFLEYDHEMFLFNVWQNIKIDSTSKQLVQLCIENMDLIISEIDEQSNLEIYSELVTIFLRTYLKEDLFNWFCRITKSMETTILSKIMKEN
jgi:hypothetical protein